MVDVIEQLQAYDIPHTSYFEAVRHMRAHYDEMSREATYHMIQNLSGMSPKFEREDDLLDHYVNLVLLYLVQESVRASFTQNFVSGEMMLPIACAKAEQYIEKNPWVFVKSDEEETIDPATGKVKLKKGMKQKLAIELYQVHLAEGRDKIIEVFQEELDMSKQGATTYFYNMRKKFGDD